jgi:hypothetical protein
MAPLVELLTATVGRLHNSLAVTDTPNAIYRLQGEVTALNDLLLSIKKAPEALARMG